MVKRTNQDDVGRDWIEKIDRDLREQRLRREERKLYSEPGRTIEPNEETSALALYAAETGGVDAKIAQGRASRPVSTENYPEIEAEEFPRDVSETVAFGYLIIWQPEREGVVNYLLAAVVGAASSYVFLKRGVPKPK